MRPLKPAGPLVSPEWLRENIAHPKLVVLDAALAAPTNKQTARDVDSSARIPGARVFDLDRVRDRENALPHMMPSAEYFTQEMRSLGLNGDSVVVVYDRLGVYSSPRARWMLKAMGHERTAVLDGGFPAWLEKGCPRESLGESAAVTGDFLARPRSGAFRDLEFVAKAMNDPGCVIIDARSEGRFRGREPEPRKDLRSGHIPGSKNIPFERVLDGASFRTPQELKILFREMDVSPEKKLIFSCGSGVTACIAALAAEIAGCPKISVYDGSWSEWGRPSARPISAA